MGTAKHLEISLTYNLRISVWSLCERLLPRCSLTPPHLPLLHHLLPTYPSSNPLTTPPPCPSAKGFIPSPQCCWTAAVAFNGENSHVLVLGAMLSEGAAGLFLGLCFWPGGEQCLLLHSRCGVIWEMGLDHSLDTPKPGAKIDPSSCWSWLPQMFRKSNRKPVDTMPREKS